MKDLPHEFLHVLAIVASTPGHFVGARLEIRWHLQFLGTTFLTVNLSLGHLCWIGFHGKFLTGNPVFFSMKYGGFPVNYRVNHFGFLVQVYRDEWQHFNNRKSPAILGDVEVTLLELIQIYIQLYISI